MHSKYRNGSEALPATPEVSHSYNAIFAGLNVGYQIQFNRLAFSIFTGYGIPVYLKEEGLPTYNENELNQGYDRDQRFGLTAGFAF